MMSDFYVNASTCMYIYIGQCPAVMTRGPNHTLPALCKVLIIRRFSGVTDLDIFSSHIQLHQVMSKNLSGLHVFFFLSLSV